MLEYEYAANPLPLRGNGQRQFLQSKIPTPLKLSNHCRYSAIITSAPHTYLFDNQREARNEMCWVESVFHLECRHWGRDRNREPCPRATPSGQSIGCSDSQPLGTVTVPQKCPRCQDQEQQGGWMPFRSLTEEGIRVIDERRRRQQPRCNGRVGRRFIMFAIFSQPQLYLSAAV